MQRQAARMQAVHGGHAAECAPCQPCVQIAKDVTATNSTSISAGLDLGGPHALV